MSVEEKNQKNIINVMKFIIKINQKVQLVAVNLSMR